MEEYTPDKKKYKWGTIVPLIGGMTVGNKEATGTDPDFFVSYPAFGDNDQHVRKYMPDVPYYMLDPETNQLKEASEEEPDINEGVDSETFEGVDFMSAVCPCAGLSMMNSSNKKGSAGARGSDAVQNQWMYKSANFVLGTVKPKVFFGENAPGLYTNTGKGVVEELKKIAESHGYAFSVYKTNSIFHGIPQKRERTFYFFWKDTGVPILDNYRREHTTFEDYLTKIPKSADMQDEYPGIGDISNNPFINFMKHKEGKGWRQAGIDSRTATNYLVRNKLVNEMLEWVESPDNFMPIEEKYREKTMKYLNHINYKLSLKKGWWDGTPHFFSETINAVIGRTIITTIHPTEDRGLNVREVLHLMGLPHDFTIPSRGYYNHAAQNVPVCTARDMTYEVLKFIDGKLPNSEEKFLKQNNSKSRLDTAIKAVKLF